MEDGHGIRMKRHTNKRKWWVIIVNEVCNHTQIQNRGWNDKHQNKYRIYNIKFNGDILDPSLDCGLELVYTQDKRIVPYKTTIP